MAQADEVALVVLHRATRIVASGASRNSASAERRRAARRSRDQRIAARSTARRRAARAGTALIEAVEKTRMRSGRSASSSARAFADAELAHLVEREEHAERLAFELGDLQLGEAKPAEELDLGDLRR